MLLFVQTSREKFAELFIRESFDVTYYMVNFRSKRVNLCAKRRNEALFRVIASQAKFLHIHLRTAMALKTQATRFKVIAARLATSNHLIVASCFSVLNDEKRGASKVLKRLDWHEFIRDNAGTFF